MNNNFYNQIKKYTCLIYSSPKESLKNSIDKIKKENYENYFIYAYNKKSYKDNEKKSKKSSKHRKPKIYKTGI